MDQNSEIELLFTKEGVEVKKKERSIITGDEIWVTLEFVQRKNFYNKRGEGKKPLTRVQIPAGA